MGWKYNDESLKKIYDESKEAQKMSYEEFKEMAEKFANDMIETTQKEIQHAKETSSE